MLEIFERVMIFAKEASVIRLFYWNYKNIIVFKSKKWENKDINLIKLFFYLYIFWVKISIFLVYYKANNFSFWIFDLDFSILRSFIKKFWV